MKLAATLIAGLFATTVFAQAPAKKEEAKHAASAAAPAKDAKAAPAKSDAKPADKKAEAAKK